MNTSTSSCGDAAQPSALLHMALTVHALYQQAQTQSTTAFEASVLAALGRELAFDAAWIGHSTLTPEGAQLHSNALHRLPADYLQAWSQVQQRDPLVAWAQSRPAQAKVLSVADADLHPDFRAFLARQGIAQVLCAANVDATLQTCLHVSLYRHALQPAFDADAQLRLQALMPNLASAIALNRLREVENTVRGQQSDELGVALISRQGVIQQANPSFGLMLRREWPDWPGGTLPAPAMRGVGPGQSHRYAGQRVGIELSTRGDLLIATVRPLSRSSLLTARERAVATQFAQGQTYKAVARKLDIAPATVRHHLRQVYAKLGVQDKGAIAWALSQEQAMATPTSPAAPLG